MEVDIRPVKLKLDRQKELRIEWNNGKTNVYPITFLRSMCPCATCKQLRESQKKSRLTVLPQNFTSDIHAIAGEMVGNYALRIEWSDNHAAGIYSFSYLLEIATD